MRQHKFPDYETYVARQVAHNKCFWGHTWVKRERIVMIAAYLQDELGAVKSGLCHGTRSGKEQQWFGEALGAEVLGTELSDNATEWPNQIQWDFHEVKPEWIGKMDFVYSNSIDHAFDPWKAIDAWMKCLRPGGLCCIEFSKQAHGDHTINALDCFGATIPEMRKALSDRYGLHHELVVNEDHVVFVLKQKGKRKRKQKPRAIHKRPWVVDRSKYIASLYHKFADDVLSMRARQRKVFAGLTGQRPMFCDIEGELLYLFMREMRPEIVAEAGAGCGWASSWMLQGLVDNGYGKLTTCDTRVLGASELPKPLAGHMDFIQGSALEVDFPTPIDFLLSDASHNAPYVYDFRDRVFPMVRSGGRICVHDVFKAAQPGHAEAISVFQYLDEKGIKCYTPSTVFPKSHARIVAARKAIGIADGFIHTDEVQYNSLLILEVP